MLYYEAVNDIPSHNGRGFGFLKTLCGGSSKIFAGLYNGTTTELAKQSEVESLKTSVSSGKAQVASAITDKGVSTSASASFSTMASNIRKIESRTESDKLIISSGQFRSSFNASRSTTSYDKVSGSVIDSMSGETLNTKKYNDVGTLIDFTSGRNAGLRVVFGVECPTATVDPDTMVLKFSGICRMNQSWDVISGDTWNYTILSITTNPLIVTAKIPSHTYRISSGTYTLTCSDLIVTAAFYVSNLGWSFGGETISIPIDNFTIRY